MNIRGLPLVFALAVTGLVDGPLAFAQAADPTADRYSSQAVEPQKLPPQTKPPRPQAVRVLDLTTVPVVISQPGTYVLNRSWLVTPTDPFSIPSLIDVRTDDVVIDFRGFELRYDIIHTGILISGANVTVRSGRLLSMSDESRAIESSGENTVVESMYIFATSGFALAGLRAVLRESETGGRFGRIVGADAVVERNRISCSATCLRVGSNGRVINNTIRGAMDHGALNIRGDGTVAIGNVFRATPDAQVVISVMGNNNIVRDNTVTWSGPPQAVISVDGGANVIDGNIGALTEVFEGWSRTRARVGIVFLADGNFYGDNRLSAVMLEQANGTTQTDWGGNIAF